MPVLAVRVDQEGGRDSEQDRDLADRRARDLERVQAQAELRLRVRRRVRSARRPGAPVEASGSIPRRRKAQ
jgi:hypothetical protein